jgi:hypothetical protein
VGTRGGKYLPLLYLALTERKVNVDCFIFFDNGPEFTEEELEVPKTCPCFYLGSLLVLDMPETLMVDWAYTDNNVPKTMRVSIAEVPVFGLFFLREFGIIFPLQKLPKEKK